MKDRQEELEPNLVADWLSGVQKKVEPYSKLILGGVVAVAVGMVSWGLYVSGQSAKRSDATLQLLMDNPEVASQYPGTVAAAWSLLFQANDNLSRGVTSLYQDREEAETLLAEAKDQFVDARGSSDDTILVSRANLGLGMAHEALGEIDDAVDAYNRCVATNESEQMVEAVQQRADRLSKPDAKEFLTWFTSQDFTPADPSLPPELPGVGSLPDLPDLDLPDLELPDLDLGDKMEASEETPEGGIELPEDSEPSAEEPKEAAAEMESEAQSGTEAEKDSNSESVEEPAETKVEKTEPAAEESTEESKTE